MFPLFASKLHQQHRESLKTPALKCQNLFFINHPKSHSNSLKACEWQRCNIKQQLRPSPSLNTAQNNLWICRADRDATRTPWIFSLSEREMPVCRLTLNPEWRSQPFILWAWKKALKNAHWQKKKKKGALPNLDRQSWGLMPSEEEKSAAHPSNNWHLGNDELL